MYNSFAMVYDEFSYDIDYKKFRGYYEKIFKKFRLKPELVLDICCGTGNLTTLMSEKYDMTGIGISCEMLDIAREKDKENKILYINQSMTDFELYGTVDACYSSLDSINYILSEKELIKHFKLVYNYLIPGGIYIFDISTANKFKNTLADNVFTDETDNAFFVWQNEYDDEDKINTMYLDVFLNNKDGSYERISEVHYEKAYNPSYVKIIAEKNRFEVLGIYDEFSFEPYKRTSERIFFVLKSKKQF